MIFFNYLRSFYLWEKGFAINIVSNKTILPLPRKASVDREKKCQQMECYENLDSLKYAKIGLGLGLIAGFFNGPGDYLLSKISNHYAYNNYLLWGNTLKEKIAFIMKDVITDAESAFANDKKAPLLKIKNSLDVLINRKFPGDTVLDHLDINKEAEKIQKIIRNKRITSILLFGALFSAITYYTCNLINKKNG